MRPRSRVSRLSCPATGRPGALALPGRAARAGERRAVGSPPGPRPPPLPPSLAPPSLVARSSLLHPGGAAPLRLAHEGLTRQYIASDPASTGTSMPVIILA